MTGKMLEARNDFKAALDAYRKGIKADPNAVEIYRALIPLAFSLNQTEEAVQHALESAAISGAAERGPGRHAVPRLGGEVHGNVVLVGHGEVDLLDVQRLQNRFSHGVERVLDREAVVVREGFEEDAPHVAPEEIATHQGHAHDQGERRHVERPLVTSHDLVKKGVLQVAPDVGVLDLCGRLSDCGWQWLSTWAWQYRTESVHYNMSSGATHFYYGSTWLYQVGTARRTIADVSPYRNWADRVNRVC